MSIFSDIGNAISSAASLVSNVGSLALNVASMVYPPLAIATSVSNMLTSVVGQAVSGAVDQLCKEAGMPKFVADLVKDVIKSVLPEQMKPSDPDCDDAAQQDFGDAVKQLGQDLQKSIVDFAKSIMDLGNDRDAEGSKGGGKGGKSGASWLVAIAKAMGAAAGEHAKNLVDLSKQIEAKSGATGDAAKEVTGLQAEFQAESQMFSMLQSAFSNAIKSIGEGMSQMARKG